MPPKDRVQVIKQESSALGGDAADSFPFDAPIEPEEDAIEAAGLYIQASGVRDENVLVTRSGDHMLFEDNTGLYTPTLTDLYSFTRVSSNDTTPGYLLDKLDFGTNVKITEVYDGLNEKLRIESKHEPSTTNPSSPSDGDLYYNTLLKMYMFYDASRSKWLSVESNVIIFGKRYGTAAGSYFRGADGLTMSSSRGFLGIFAGTVVSLGYTRTDSDTVTFEVVKNGSSLATLASSSTSGATTSLNADFAQNDILAVKNQSSGNTVSNVTGWIRVRWRVS